MWLGAALARGAAAGVVVVMATACGQTVPHATAGRAATGVGVAVAEAAAEDSVTATPTDTAAPAVVTPAAPAPRRSPAATGEREGTGRATAETQQRRAGTDRAAADPGASPDPARVLWNRVFVSESVREDGRPRALIDDRDLTLRFEKRDDHVAVAWQSACNWSGARLVAATADTLDIALEGGTLMGCPRAHHEQDDWFDDFFSADPRWRLDGEVLTLTADGVVIRLRQRPAA